MNSKNLLLVLYFAVAHVPRWRNYFKHHLAKSVVVIFIKWVFMRTTMQTIILPFKIIDLLLTSMEPPIMLRYATTCHILHLHSFRGTL